MFEPHEIAAAVTAYSVESPFGAEGLGTHFARLAAVHPGREALVCGSVRHTFEEVDRRTNRMARALTGRGAVPGKTVAIVLPNCVEFHEVAIASWKVGATAVPISHRAPPLERTRLFELADPAVAVVADRSTGGASMTLDELLAEATQMDDDPHPDVSSRPWLAIASGGSTGTPKLIVKEESGPMHPSQAAILGMREGGRQLVAGPLYHSGPFSWGVIHLMAAAGTIVIMERFDAEGFLQAIEAERIGWAMVVPTMLHRIMDLPEEVRGRYDLASLEVLLHGAAPCPPALKRRVIDFLGAERVWEVYGATEVGLSLIRGDEWLARPGSVGRLLDVYEAEVRDDSGEELRANEVGEIWIRQLGGAKFSYRGAKPEVGADGFVSVGDLGYVDSDGYLYLSDRRTDMIVSGGSNVFPAEVEASLLEHPAVSDAAVVGLPDPEWGQRVHAIVEPRDLSRPPTADELALFCRDRLMPYKVPKTYELVDELPRDPSGKLRRGQLRAERVTPRS